MKIIVKEKQKKDKYSKCPMGLVILTTIEKLVVRMFREGNVLGKGKKQSGLTEQWKL